MPKNNKQTNETENTYMLACLLATNCWKVRIIRLVGKCFTATMQILTFSIVWEFMSHLWFWHLWKAIFCIGQEEEEENPKRKKERKKMQPRLVPLPYLYGLPIVIPWNPRVVVFLFFSAPMIFLGLKFHHFLTKKIWEVYFLFLV